MSQASSHQRVVAPDALAQDACLAAPFLSLKCLLRGSIEKDTFPWVASYYLACALPFIPGAIFILSAHLSLSMKEGSKVCVNGVTGSKGH